MERFKRIANSGGKGINWVAAGGLVAMMLLTCADIVMRSLGRPILGTFEIVGFLGVVVAAFAIAYTQIMRGHISVDFLVLRLPQRAQGIISSIVYLLSIGLFILIAWQSCRFARDLWLSGEVSPTEQIPFFPFVYGIALACIPVCLVLLVDLFKSLAQAVKK